MIKILFYSGTSEKNKIWVDFGNSKFEEASSNKMEFAIVKENEIIAIPNFDASYFIISTGNLSNNVQIKMIEILYEK